MNKKFAKFYVPQVDERDCGVAALDMIFKVYGSLSSLARLRTIAKTDLEGTTAYGIVHAAQQFGFDTHTVRADMSLFDMDNLLYPFIAHVNRKGKYLHYYVVFGARKNSIIIGDPDPSVGIIEMPKKEFAEEWSGVAIFIAPTPSYKPTREDKGSLLNFVPVLAKHTKLITLVVVASVLGTVISIAGSYFIQAMIDTYIPGAMMSTLGVIASGLIFAYAFQSVFSYAQGFLLNVLGQRLTIDVTLGYLRHLFHLPMSFFSTRRTGEIVSRFSDASKIIDALASTIITVFLDVWIVLIVGIVLCVQNSRLFLLSLVALPCYVVIVWAFKGRFNRLNQNTMESNAILSSSIIEDLNGIQTIKAMTGEHKSYGKVDHEFADFLKKSFQYSNTDLLQQSIKAALKLILNVAVLWVGALLVIHNQLSLGQLFTYNALLAYFTNPLESIINLQPKLQMAKVANNRLNEVLLVTSEYERERPVKDASAVHGDIVVNHISFRYGFGPEVLQDVNLTIPEHQKMTIVGMSGSGKSTLAQLLTGLSALEPGQGEIKIGDVNIDEIDRTALRQHVVYVPQEPDIFSGTVFDNLLLGVERDIQPAEVERACAMAEIKEDIERLPQQYASDLSESGSILSGGQKQRITIARAILTAAPVMIFDESTSNLDTITERKIVHHLLGMTDTTIIFVAHRLTIAEQTDHIVVLDHGKLVEQGSHDALLARKNGYYAAMFAKD
ncbi:peptide cleavage/export ABC transporter [Schleiferilactobacillus shenzhenensis]|nr:peptide cleavage/export ABC transporter [Schleiferilactobacillus shenzhenensis]